MKILVVSTSERNGGAAVAANRLMQALNNNGARAKMLVRDKASRSDAVAQVGGRLLNGWNFVYERFVIWCCNLFSTANLFKVSIANTGIDITKTEEFKEADIVHLHWVNQGFLSRKSIRKILQSGKPVVWTMHDMWELTAICHHAYECRRYESGCSHCQFLRRPGSNDLSSRNFRRKKRLFAQAGNLTFVAVSQWLAERARRSALVGHLPVEVIPNALSLSHFTIVDRMDARTALGVGEPYVLAFGAARIDDPIKGFDYLVEALRLLVDDPRFPSRQLRLLLFGNVRNADVLSQIPVPYTHLGYVTDEGRLSLVYSAANVTVSSSLYETFGQTLIEAMACGCLPVSFGGSGQSDIVSHRQTGFLAERLSAASLAEGIAWALQQQIPALDLRRNVMRRYVESVVANRYMRLYQSILEKQS